MSAPSAFAPAPAPLNDSDIEHLQKLLDALPAPCQPLDVMALDGYLCGVLLQPQAVAEPAWWPGVLDVEGRALPPGQPTEALASLVRRRQAELEQAIAGRDWFDPWVFALDEEASVSEQVLPWVAGFSAATERFPALTAIDSPELLEPLALLYLHFDHDDLEDADALLALIEEIEPPPDLAEAVQDIVRAVMLMADVSRPLDDEPRRQAARPPQRRGLRPGQQRPRGGGPGARRR
jgi:uncharacterized protein